MKANEVLIYIKDKVNLAGMKKLQGRMKSFGASVKKAFNSKPVRNFKIAVAAVTATIIASIKEARKKIEAALGVKIWSDPEIGTDQVGGE